MCTIFTTPGRSDEEADEDDLRTVGIHLIKTVHVRKGLQLFLPPMIHQVMSVNARVKKKTIHAFHFLLEQDFLWKILFNSTLVKIQPARLEWRFIMGRLLLLQYVLSLPEIILVLSEDDELRKCASSTSALQQIAIFLAECIKLSEEKVVTLAVSCVHTLYVHVGKSRTVHLWPSTVLPEIHVKLTLKFV